MVWFPSFGLGRGRGATHDERVKQEVRRMRKGKDRWRDRVPTGVA
jgi:hypothetical protein